MDFLTEEQRHIRASDQEREEVIEHLKACANEGRLNLEELSDRVQTAIASKTLGELQDICADLPDDPVASLLQILQDHQESINLEEWHNNRIAERHRTRSTVLFAILAYMLMAPMAVATMRSGSFGIVLLVAVCFIIIYIKKFR